MQRERRGRFRSALVLCGALAAALAANGTPLTAGTTSPPRWPDGSRLNIYVQADPSAPPDRSALFKEGLERWSSVLTARGISFTVTVGDPPDPKPKSSVVFEYKANGSQIPGEGPQLDDDNWSCCGPAWTPSGKIVLGEGYIRDDLAAGTDAEKEHVRNLGQHEMVHLLGLGDDKDGTVTAHAQGNTAVTFDDTDLKELDSLYPLPQTEESKAEGETQQSVDPTHYDWDFAYAGPVGGHVALITMDVQAATIVSVTPPAGWVVLDPSDPARLDRESAFYQDYMEDGAPLPPPWHPNVRPPLAFRALSEADTLSVSNPTISMSLVATGATRGPMQVWAGGDLQWIVGPVAGGAVPALPPAALIVLSVVLAAVALHRIRLRAARA